jgi:hypothetical protein
VERGTQTNCRLLLDLAKQLHSEGDSIGNRQF